MVAIAALHPTDASLEVTWTDGVVSRYPWLWLRDHAHDGDTLHPVTQQRQLFTAAVPKGLRGLSYDVVGDGLEVTWDVLEPMSRLPVAFLAQYRHPRVARAAVDVPVTLWNGASLTTPFRAVRGGHERRRRRGAVAGPNPAVRVLHRHRYAAHRHGHGSAVAPRRLYP
jgi:hypothetical protein